MSLTNDDSIAGKHDVFVGNLAMNTTEEQLMEVFSDAGRVVRVRMITDPDTMTFRGFAFVEYFDHPSALSAIRNMNDYDLNGRKIRVNFSHSSHNEGLAGKLGMDVQSQSKQSVGPGTLSVSEALKGMTKGELYDVLSRLKEIVEQDPDEARRILSGHPQLQEAFLFAMSKLEMVKTPIAQTTPNLVLPLPPTVAALDQAAVVPKISNAADPRILDPRRARDPRQRVVVPTSNTSEYTNSTSAGATNTPLNPALIQQVLSLTPQQIAQLPPDKSASIIALRNEILSVRKM
jgi:cleavage stimulation factor subunit 2